MLFYRFIYLYMIGVQFIEYTYYFIILSPTKNRGILQKSTYLRRGNSNVERNDFTSI